MGWPFFTDLSNSHILARLLAVAGLLDTSEWTLGRGCIAGVHTDHASLEILKQSPCAVDVLSEEVCVAISTIQLQQGMV